MSDRAQSIQRANEAFAAWQERNRGGQFRDYYVERVRASLAKGASHPTLGHKLKRADPENAGAFNMQLLVREGLLPSHTCVDYGCGSLRVGRRLIEYLDTGRYWGLDVTDQFYRAGLQQLDDDVVTEKQPTLQVISPESLALVREQKPHTITSNGVFQHVPPFELDTFLSELTGVIVPGTKALVQVKLADEPVQTSWSSWLYSPADLEAAFQALGCELDVIHVTPFQPTGFDIDASDAWIRITRSQS